MALVQLSTLVPFLPVETPRKRLERQKFTCKFNSTVGNAIDAPSDPPSRPPFQSSRRTNNNHGNPKLRPCRIFQGYDQRVSLVQLSVIVPSPTTRTPLRRLGRQKFTRKFNSTVGNVIDAPLNQPSRPPFRSSWRKDDNHSDPKLQPHRIVRRCDQRVALVQLSAIVPSPPAETRPKRLG